jgi:hypothetical protein
MWLPHVLLWKHQGICAAQTLLRSSTQGHAASAALTLSIWMKDTVRYRYAALPSHSTPAKRRPIGRMQLQRQQQASVWDYDTQVQTAHAARCPDYLALL